MTCPNGFIIEIVFAVVCNSELLEVNVIFNLKVVIEPVIRIVVAICVLRNSFGCDYYSIFCICIGYRRSVNLTILGSPNMCM